MSRPCSTRGGASVSGRPAIGKRVEEKCRQRERGCTPGANQTRAAGSPGSEDRTSQLRTHERSRQASNGDDHTKDEHEPGQARGRGCPRKPCPDCDTNHGSEVERRRFLEDADCSNKESWREHTSEPKKPDERSDAQAGGSCRSIEAWTRHGV